VIGAGPRAAADQPTILETLEVDAVLLRFVFNLAISALAMGAGPRRTLSRLRPDLALRPYERGVADHIFFRNAPWLVLLFYCCSCCVSDHHLRRHVRCRTGSGDVRPALPVMANVSEILRGAVRRSHDAVSRQRRSHSPAADVWMIIFPRCIKRMLPPWMNLYAILTMATVLVSIVGVRT
jgi:polar amino acid transport system permease protein